jgi:hypothetical protein
VEGVQPAVESADGELQPLRAASVTDDVDDILPLRDGLNRGGVEQPVAAE